MVELEKEEIKRITDFIEENDLFLNYSEGELFRFKVFSDDEMTFQFFKINDGYVVSKYDKNKDILGVPSDPYQYFNFKNIPQILEQLKLYDEQIPRTLWVPTTNTIDFNHDQTIFESNWTKDFIVNEKWSERKDGEFPILVYEDISVQPNLKSPFNTLHEVSEFNQLVYEKVNKLYFEIHPKSLQKRNEKFLFKLLINNEEIFKEYASFDVIRKKGLKLLIESIFKSIY
jgi:hypothetical protein